MISWAASLRRWRLALRQGQKGAIDFEEFKDIAKQITQVMNDDEFLEMLQSMHIN